MATYYIAELLDTPINLLSIKDKSMLITLAASPKDSLKLRGWYQNKANCPDWWTSVNLPWLSQNHQCGENPCYFTASELNALINTVFKRR